MPAALIRADQRGPGWHAGRVGRAGMAGPEEGFARAVARGQGRDTGWGG
jgi:hypothetical protein